MGLESQLALSSSYSPRKPQCCRCTTCSCALSLLIVSCLSYRTTKQKDKKGKERKETKNVHAVLHDIYLQRTKSHTRSPWMTLTTRRLGWMSSRSALALLPSCCSRCCCFFPASGIGCKLLACLQPTACWGPDKFGACV